MSLEQFADAPSFRPSDEGIKAYELWQLQKRKGEIRKSHLDHWNSTRVLTSTGRPVDAIVSPMAPYAAPPHGKNRHVADAHFCLSSSLIYLYQGRELYDGLERS